MKENIPATISMTVKMAPSKAASPEFVDFDREVVTFADCGMAFCVSPFDCGPNGSGLLGFSGPEDVLQTFRSAKPDPHNSVLFAY